VKIVTITITMSELDFDDMVSGMRSALDMAEDEEFDDTQVVRELLFAADADIDMRDAALSIDVEYDGIDDEALGATEGD